MGISTSTGTLIAGQSRTFNLSPASAVTLTLSPNVRVTITETPATVAATGLGGNASRVHEPRLPGTFTYGPYPMGGTVVVDVESNSGSSVAWVRSDSIVAESADGAQFLMDGGGKAYPVAQLGQLVDLVPSQVLNDCIFGQLPDGRFVGMGDNDSSSDIRLWISTSYVGGTITRMNATATFVVSGGLQDTAGVEWSGAGAKIVNAWCPSNGDVLMLVQASGVANYHLFRCKANNNALGAANSIGSDGSYSNKKSCLDLGRITQGSGAITPNVRALSGKSFCEATIAGAKVYLFAEYNVQTGRVAGSTDDQCFVWKSTDAGATWSKLLTFNTDGSNTNIDHFHSVVQDPYTGWVYFMTGDVDAKNRVIAWDGVSAAPAANASIATINSTAGWKCIGGDELKRYTDLCFGPAGIYTMPDSDDEATEASTTSFVGTTLPRTLDYVTTIAPAVGRVAKVPPLLAFRSPDGWAAFVTFRTTGAAENYLQIWLQSDPNGFLPWRLSNKVRNYLTSTATPAQFFLGTDGAVYLGGKSGNSIQFTSAAKTATTVRFDVAAYTGALNTFDGA